MGFTLGLFTIFGIAALPHLSYAADKAPCWNIDLGPTGVDLCSVLEQARDFMSRLKPSTADNLEKISEEFELERSLRIQQALFREDLNWLNRGYSTRQIDVMVFIAVALSLERAMDLTVELRRAYESTADPKSKARLEAVVLYQAQALSLLHGLSRQLEKVPDYELKFYF